MTIHEKTGPQKQRLSRSKQKPRNPGVDNYDAPTVAGPSLLGETDDDPGNHVRKQDQGLAMDVKFANLAAGGSPDGTNVRVQAKWNGTLVGNIVTGKTPLAANWADDKTLIIPANLTNVAGEHDLRYRVFFGLNGKDSELTTIRVDKEPPLLAAPVTYPAEIVKDGFTAEYFTDVSPHATLSYGTYTVAKTGDSFEFWIGAVGADGNPTPDSTLIETKVLVSPREPLETKKLTRALIKIDEGSVDLFAYATDRKGNRSLVSPPVTVPVSMIPQPRDFTTQIVLADGDVTDRPALFRDAQEPVHIEHAFINWRSGDKLRREIGSQGAKVLDISVAPPFVDEIIYKELLDDGNLDLKDLRYTYQIQRGVKLIPETPLERILKVHLDKPGEQPDDPDKPGDKDSVDPKLNLIDVQGVQGRLNYLNKQDATLGAIALLKIYKGHKKGDEIEVLYKGAPLPGFLVLDGTETDDTILKIDIPGDYIANGGNSKKLDVFYYVYHPDVNGTVSVAGKQEVDVYVDEIPMPQPGFKVTGDDGNGDGDTVYCDSLVRDPDTNEVAVEVTFDADPKFADKVIRFVIQGFENVVDAGRNRPGVQIPDTFATVSKTPSLAEAEAGFSVFFPHETFQKIFNGWCEIRCSTQQDGYHTPSAPKLFRVTMNHGDTNYCDLPPRITK